jgi:hypothetical protein
MATYRYATKQLSIASAKAFIEKIQTVDETSEKKSTILYAVLGHSNQWDNEPTQNTIHPSRQNSELYPYRNFIGGKKISSGDVSHVARRVDWISGNVYPMYKDTIGDLYDTDFYMMTDEYNVYKCLYNNKGAVSTVKPTGFTSSSITLSDGYTWKYMYSISLGDAEKFMTTNHIPVKTLSNPDSTPEQTRQAAVQNAAVNGSIEIVETDIIGSGYYQLDNVDVEAATDTTLRFSGLGSGLYGSLSTNDDFYSGSSVYIKSGTGSGQLRRITDYVGETKTLTVNSAFTTTPDQTSTAIISPTVTIIGDGSGAKAYVKVHTGTGTVANVSVISVGSHYTRAKSYISGGQGTGATANAIISPKGGHGADSISELGGDKLMLNVKFQGSEGVSSTGRGYIPANTEFRTISILQDPVLKVNSNNEPVVVESVANTSNSPSTLRFSHRATISYENMDGDFPTNPLYADDIITNERMRLAAELGTLEFVTELVPQDREDNAMRNALQGANAQIIYIRDDEVKDDTSFYTIYLNSVQSNSDRIAFAKDDTILKKGSEEKVAVIEDYVYPEANTFSGNILYVENIEKVTKDPDQLEDIKVILDF